MSRTLEALRRIESRIAVLPAQRSVPTKLKTRKGTAIDGTADSATIQPFAEPVPFFRQTPAEVAPPRLNVGAVEDQPPSAVCAVADESSPADVPYLELPADRPAREPSQPLETSQICWPDRSDQNAGYDRLATSFLTRHAAGRPTAILFTSPSDGDGKTELLTALAPALAARAQRSVLVVDADFRRGDLSARLATFNDGLAGLLAGTATVAEVALPTTIAQLSILPHGNQLFWEEEGDARLSAWEAVLDDLKRRYPLVLLDAPSLAHAHVASMGSVCDGVCLVVRLGQTSRRAVRRSRQVIRTSGGRLWGCIAIRE
jgi:Mrp family chromosome partitioning ATPase